MQIDDVRKSIVTLEKTNFDYPGLTGKQLISFKGFEPENLQSHITQINDIQSRYSALQPQFRDVLFDTGEAQLYAQALSDVDSSQAALLLSTQGLANAQIQRVLAANGMTAADQYQAMADAGLLKAKQSLTAAQAQQTLQTVLGTDADINAAMASLGLSAAAGAEETQTVKLTAKKLQEAVASGKLTQAQAQEIGMRTGVLISMNAQKAIFPQLIARMKAMAIAIKEQIVLNIQWAMRISSFLPPTGTRKRPSRASAKQSSTRCRSSLPGMPSIPSTALPPRPRQSNIWQAQMKTWRTPPSTRQSRR